MKIVPSLILMSFGIFCYACAYFSRAYAVPNMRTSTLMFFSGLTILVFSIIMKVSETGTPWFDFSTDRNILLQVGGVVGYCVFLAFGDQSYLTGMKNPKVTLAMAGCVFALMPMFEGLLAAIFTTGKMIKPGQIGALALVVVGFVTYILQEE